MSPSEPRDIANAHSADLLPPAPIGKALLFAATVAAAGAVAWGLLVVSTRTEYGVLAWAIGAAVGFATVKAGGHGTLLAIAAGALALVSISSGKRFAFHMVVEREVQGFVQQLNADAHADFGKQAAAWVALGPKPTTPQVEQFAREHELDVADLDDDFSATMQQFVQEKPTLEKWREQMGAHVVARASFFDYLKDDFQPVDILFAVLGIASAFGLVRRATAAMRAAALQAAADASNANAG